MTRGMNNGRKLKIRRYGDLVTENLRLKGELAAVTAERDAMRGLLRQAQRHVQTERDDTLNAEIDEALAAVEEK